MIVKIQRPIFPKGGPLLVYNKTRSFYAEMADTPALASILPDELKGYFDAELVGDELQIGDRVADRNW